VTVPICVSAHCRRTSIHWTPHRRRLWKEAKRWLRGHTAPDGLTVAAPQVNSNLCAVLECDRHHRLPLFSDEVRASTRAIRWSVLIRAGAGQSIGTQADTRLAPRKAARTPNQIGREKLPKTEKTGAKKPETTRFQTRRRARTLPGCPPRFKTGLWGCQIKS